MAASVVILEDQLHSHYKLFCHVCMVEIENLSADNTCPICASGFIERLPISRTTEVEMQDDRQNDMRSTLISIMSAAEIQQAVIDENPDTPSGDDIDIHRFLDRLLDIPPHQSENLFEKIVLLSIGPYSSAFLTRLFEQMKRGPPSLTKDEIAAIPKVDVCTICLADFQLTETVRRLSCVHIYHENCIIPWLESHDTCPLCRKTVSSDADLPNILRTTVELFRNEMVARDSNTFLTNQPSNQSNRTAGSVRQTRSMTRRQQLLLQQSPASQSQSFQSTNERMRDDDGNIE